MSRVSRGSLIAPVEIRASQVCHYLSEKLHVFHISVRFEA